MNLIEAFELGKVDEYGLPERSLETAISKLFFYPERVIKVYKQGEYFFANLQDAESRKKFYEDDFFWNNSASPDIYLKLGEYDGDRYIEMEKIDGGQTFTNLMQAGKLSVPDVEVLAQVMVERLKFLTKEKQELVQEFGTSWRKHWEERLGSDLPEWNALAKDHVPPEEVQSILDVMRSITASDSYFSEFDVRRLSIQIDNNCDNVLWVDGKPGFIDSMPPKEGWRVFDELGVVARLAVDAYVLGGKEYGDAVYRTYAGGTNISEGARLMYDLNGALVQWPYRHMLGQHELADKYRDFIYARLTETGNI